jgi:hypothetical protein
LLQDSFGGVIEYASPFTSVSQTPPASALRMFAELGVVGGGGFVGLELEVEPPPLQPAANRTTDKSNVSAARLPDIPW